MPRLIEIIHKYDDGSEAHFPVASSDSDAGLPSWRAIATGAGAIFTLLVILAVAL
jgi:hypothetical protein